VIAVAGLSSGAEFAQIERAITASFPAGSQSLLRFYGLAKAENDAESRYPELFAEIFGSDQPLLFLIRPDGYVGFRGTPAHLNEFRGYLNRWLSPAG
jgi:hypothetical protein